MNKNILAIPAIALTATLFAPATAATAGSDVYLAATLVGKNEVPAPGTKVGDKDGSAIAVFRIHGNQVDYAIRWQRVSAPTAFHIHQGKAGKNGDVKIPFFGQALPGSLSAVKGTVTVADS
ncbi:CHRD domain-containing protein, partial [Nonomuraea angiospora]